ncbi:alanine/glycine:cation symporter family protein [Acidobacteriota bacterium]
MEGLVEFSDKVASTFLGLPFLLVLLGAGCYFTIALRFVQWRRLFHAVRIIRGDYDDPKDTGDITHFQALTTALSATIGVGNIAGVGLAVALGGPGAIFWMWVTGVFGMATKYVTCMLAQVYRKVHPDGSISGGPMYYIVMGLGKRFKWLAIWFALFGAIASMGIGNMAQSNSMAEAFRDEFGPWIYGHVVSEKALTFQIGPYQGNGINIVLGLFISLVVGLVIIGGIKRIGKVASRLVPSMCILYVLGALFILTLNYKAIPDAFWLIFKHAFTPTSAVGGFAGATLLYTITRGVRRAMFSNEAGLGSAPIAHAAAKTEEPAREGLVAMVGPMVDTLLICTLTALTIITTGMWSSGQKGAVLTKSAFKEGIEFELLGAHINPGGLIVALGLILFAISTAISWSYYGDRCTEFLFGSRAIVVYRWIFVFFLFVGANTDLDIVWNFSDATMFFMAFPNLIASIALAGVVVKMTQEYFSKPQIPFRRQKGNDGTKR